MLHLCVLTPESVYFIVIFFPVIMMSNFCCPGPAFVWIVSVYAFDFMCISVLCISRANYLLLIAMHIQYVHSLAFG